MKLAGDVIPKGRQSRGVVFVPIGMLNLELGKELIRFLLRLGERNSLLEAADHREGIPPGAPEIHGSGDKEVDFHSGSKGCAEIESGGKYADHCGRGSIDGDGFA